MSITVGDNFSYQGGKPLDARFQFSSVANMKAFAEASLYDGCLAYIPSSKKYYTYDSSNTTDQTTGKWREFETGGGGGTSDYNDLTNKPKIAGITLSGNQSLASFGLTSDVETQSDGSTTKSYVNRGEKYNWNTGSTWYGTCSTSASTTAKSVTLVIGILNFTAGAKIAVKFSYTNTASAPTLTVNSTTKNIKYIDADGNVSTPLIWWNAGDVVEFTYDGTQWLMQPTMQMLFSGQGTKIPRESIYSTSEKVVGCWVDGRPVYQKTINFGTLPNAAPKSVNHGISSLGNIVDAFGVFWNSSKVTGTIPYNSVNQSGQSGTNSTVAMHLNTTQVVLVTFIDLSSYTNCYITVQYTKTTDAANSFNYGDPNEYSTTEKIVGTWVDGKTLYQKTINFGALPNNTVKSVAHNISNLNKVIEISGYSVNPNASPKTYTPINASNQYWSIYTSITSTNIQILTNSDLSAQTETYITIKYTKS